MKTIMKRKNMLVYLMITIFVLTTFTFASFAQTITENKIDLMTDGVIYPPEKGFGELFFDKNGRTQIPVRWASGVIGATLEWNPETGGIVITRGEFKVEFEIGSNVYIDNGTPKEMDTVAFVIENRTYVPIRFLAEPLGYKVDYIRNQGQVKESKRDHVVKLIYTGEVEGEQEAENDSSSNNVKGINLKADFSKSKELQALKEKASLEFSEGYIGANFNPERSWIPPFMFSSNEEYGYYDFTLPYDPQNEEAYLEVLKYALQHSVEAGDVIFDRFEDMNTTLSNRNLSKADRADYVSKNINKFIKVKEGIYYNITADEGGNIGLIVSKTPLW